MALDPKKPTSKKQKKVEKNTFSSSFSQSAASSASFSSNKPTTSLAKSSAQIVTKGKKNEATMELIPLPSENDESLCLSDGSGVPEWADGESVLLSGGEQFAKK
jgi:hypothetical protein